MKLTFNSLLPYTVVAVKAVVIAVLGYIVAVISRKITISVCNSFESLKKQSEFSKSAGSMVYYLVLLITVVAVLEALGLKYVTQPFLDLLNKIASYIPNIIGAIVIFVVGIFFARITKEFTNSLIETFQIEKISKKYGVENLGELFGNIIYIFILLFIVIATLNALQISSITDPAVSMLTVILNAIPRMVAALIVFGTIFYIGKVIANITTTVVDELNIDETAKEIGISHNRINFRDLVKYTILTFATLLGSSQAFHYLNAQALYQLTYQFTVIAFKLVVASIILFGGIYFGNLFEKKLENKTFGKVVKIAFIVSTIFIALPYIGVSPQVIETVVLSICLSIGLAFALAFGLGGREIATDILRKLMDSDENQKE